MHFEPLEIDFAPPKMHFGPREMDLEGFGGPWAAVQGGFEPRKTLWLPSTAFLGSIGRS